MPAKVERFDERNDDLKDIYILEKSGQVYKYRLFRLFFILLDKKHGFSLWKIETFDPILSLNRIGRIYKKKKEMYYCRLLIITRVSG